MKKLKEILEKGSSTESFRELCVYFREESEDLENELLFAKEALVPWKPTHCLLFLHGQEDLKKGSFLSVSPFLPLVKILDITNFPFEQESRTKEFVSFFLSVDFQGIRITGLYQNESLFSTRFQSLPPLPQIKECYLQKFDHRLDTSFLSRQVQIKSLSLSHIREKFDVGFLSSLKSLQRLWCNQVNLGGLSNNPSPLPNIEEIRFEHCHAKQELSLSWMTSCPKLRDVGIIRCKKLSFSLDFSSFSGLLSLDLEGYRELRDISFLERSPTLTHLNLYGCWRIKDYQPLHNLRKLVYLDLGLHHELGDLDFLASLTFLRTLKLHKCKQLQELGKMYRCTELRYLDLRGCKNLMSLSGCEKLEQLQVLLLLDNQKLTDIRELSGLKQLKKVSITGCHGLSWLEEKLEIEGKNSHDILFQGEKETIFHSNYKKKGK